MAAAEHPARPLLEQLPIVVALFDRELRCLWLNHAAAALAGRRLEEARGRSLRELFPSLAEGLMPIASVTLESCVRFTGIDLPPMTGAVRRWTASGFVLGESLAIALVPSTLPEASLDRETLFRAVFERAPIGLIVLEYRGMGVRVNGALQRMLGYTAEELASIGIQGITHPDDFAVDLDRFQRLMAGEIDEYSLVKRYLKKDGSVMWAHLTVSVARDAKGDPELIISSIEDVTEGKRAERERERLLRELEQAVQARDVFFAIASHELRTPLTPLQLSLQALEEHGTAGPELELALRQVRRLAGLVDLMLDVSRIDAGQVEIVKERIDLAALGRAVVQRMFAAAAREGCTLTFDAAAPVVVLADPLRMERVVADLLGNAIKFGAGGTVWVTVAADAARALLSVRDEGIGIAPADQARIFERYARAVSEMEYGGFGLGLFVSGEIVKLHGGTIRVHSEPGRGATFTVELPLAAAGA